MSINKIKSRVKECIDKRKKEIIALGEDIYKNPETGFKEFETSQKVVDKFKDLKLEYVQAGNIPGVKATIDTGKPGPGLAIIGELDSVICSEHPHSNPKTGAVHACGHNVQIAVMTGAAIGLLDSGVIDSLSGKIHLIAVPAEEYIEVGFRKELRDKDIIRYLGGKPEFLVRGLLDDVDLAALLHLNASGTSKMKIQESSNGCIVKMIKYTGKAAHAGGAPHNGINALYAANIGLSAINALRETFRECDYIRVHPIITKGGDIVNVIPSEVYIETFVRGKAVEAIMDANKKVDRALAGGAVAMGAEVLIEDLPGYFPAHYMKELRSMTKNIMLEMVSEEEIDETGHGTGSTDMGDLSMLMPVIHPYIGGATGGGHSASFRITDPDTAYILGSKYLALLAVELMQGEAANAKKIINKYQPYFKSKEEYFKFTDKLFATKKFSYESFEK